MYQTRSAGTVVFSLAEKGYVMAKSIAFPIAPSLNRPKM
jgi:hypothetical protein